MTRKHLSLVSPLFENLQLWLGDISLRFFTLVAFHTEKRIRRVLNIHKASESLETSAVYLTWVNERVTSHHPNAMKPVFMTFLIYSLVPESQRVTICTWTLTITICSSTHKAKWILCNQGTSYQGEGKLVKDSKKKEEKGWGRSSKKTNIKKKVCLGGGVVQKVQFSLSIPVLIKTALNAWVSSSCSWKPHQSLHSIYRLRLQQSRSFRLIYEQQFELPCILILTKEDEFLCVYMK